MNCTFVGVFYYTLRTTIVSTSLLFEPRAYFILYLNSKETRVKLVLNQNRQRFQSPRGLRFPFFKPINRDVNTTNRLAYLAFSFLLFFYLSVVVL
jgi:hypothetical protein